MELRFAPVPWWRPWDRGLWATAREDYAPTPLPSAFSVEVRSVLGAQRRVATAPGEGRPVLILPGAYARLDEGLFARVAAAFAARGHPVTLVEDRLAAATLRANGGEVPTLSRQADEARALAASLPELPDLVAFSAGWLVARAIPAARRVGWSAVVDPEAVRARVATHPILRAYYQRVHARSFAGLAVPSLADTWAALGAPPAPVDAPTLLVHAEDDPVVPVASVRSAATARVIVTRGGGHLAFGVVAGLDVYLCPLVAT